MPEYRRSSSNIRSRQATNRHTTNRRIKDRRRRHPMDRFEVYIDIKDSNSYHKAQRLREVCSNSMYDFSHKVIKRIQPVRSDEIEIMQIVDILIGAVGYQNRKFPHGFIKSPAKLEIIDLIKKRSNYTLQRTTLLRENKFNLFVWEAGEIC